MLSIPLILVLILIMAVVQIAIFLSLPKWLKRLFASVLLLGVFINFMLSGIILVFTSAGLLAGTGNLGGSVIFGIFLEVYRRKRGIERPRLVWVVYRKQFMVRVLRLISMKLSIPFFAFPLVQIPENNPDVKGWLWQ